MQWLIDIIKEWVIAQAYATMAWVVQYVPPLFVTGVLNPNATCGYHIDGIYNSKPYYRRGDGSFYIWWNGIASWYISLGVGVLPPGAWIRTDPSHLGLYTHVGVFLGDATVIQGSKYLSQSFINRGDPAADDYTKADFITDGTWREKDLSAIVPAGATAVLVRLSINDNFIDQRARFARHGDVNYKATSDMITQVANLYNTLPVVISIDTDRKIDYFFSNTSWTAIYFTVIGWWL